MMMETAGDPYDLLFGDVSKSSDSEGLLFPNDVMLGVFNTDSSSISPISNTIDNGGSNIPHILSKLSNFVFFSNL